VAGIAIGQGHHLHRVAQLAINGSQAAGMKLGVVGMSAKDQES